jgi:small subunit ribosomal protein S8
MMTDPIADLLTRIRNASRAEHEKLDIPASRLKVRIAEILKSEGFIKNFRIIEEAGRPGSVLRVYLKYGTGNEQIISGIVRVSKPGRRVYVGKDRIPSILGGMGVAILSTSRGVMTDREVRKQQLGGEVLAYVW